MTTHEIPAANWSNALAKALRNSEPGDVIIVNSIPQALLGETAAQRMGKEGITIKVKEK